MANISITRDTKANIDAIPTTDGRMYFTTDQTDNHIYTDVGTNRIQIGGVTDAIGGANLLTGSKDFSGTWTNSVGWTTDVSYRGFTVKKRSTTGAGLIQALTFPAGVTVVYSFYAKTSNPSAIYNVIAAPGTRFTPASVALSLTTDWKKYEFVFTSVIDEAILYARLECNTTGVDTYICAPCLQYGNKSTGWTPNELDAIAPLVYNGAAHNSIYRGKNLGTSVTASQYTAISAGTFDDLYIGDYWTIGGVNYRIAAFDYYWNCGDNAIPPHHAVIVPEKSLYNAMMNTTDTTTGGYVGSQMYTTNLAQAKTTIKAAFSGHVVKHRIYLVNEVANGYSSGGAWYDSEVDLMNEEMVYGSGIFSPVSTANYRVEKNQLPLFAMNPAMLNTRETYWLRDVINACYFARVLYDGRADANIASNIFGVRPSFCIS